MSLVEETQKEMGYTPNVSTCAKCAYMVELDHPVLDREWVPTCTYSNLCKFAVSKDGTCGKWEPKSGA